jgi:hypothetical protein
MGNAYKIVIRTPQGKDYLKTLETDGRIILKWIFKM